MELEDVKIKIQDFFDENTLTIVGSGLSIAEGIPGMIELSRELRAKVPSLITGRENLDAWRYIDELLECGKGLEETLHLVPATFEIENSIKAVTGNFMRVAESKVLNNVIRFGEKLRFSEYIKLFNIRNEGLTVITTNYDRLIEYSCEQSKVRIDTLFVGKYISYFSPDESKTSFCKSIHKSKGQTRMQYAPKITVLKPHGCLSWYLIDGVPYSIPQETGNDCLIITPGSNKYKAGYEAPFDTHREQANRAIDAAIKYVIIGYGFGDSHLEVHLNEQIKNKQVLILTHSLSNKAYDICKKCGRITALVSAEENGITGSKVITKSEEEFFPHINIWDVREMIKEVFK